MSAETEKASRGGPVIRLGVSTCLLGERVRYDGGHQLDRYLTGTLGRFVEWVPVCPEVEMGLPIPRESLRQVGDPVGCRRVARLCVQEGFTKFWLIPCESV
jgi:uncharacterized protein YbbK (DUF523 family)